MNRTTAIAIAVACFVTLVGCDKDNKQPTPYTSQGPNGTQLPQGPNGQGPNGPNGQGPNGPQPMMPPSQNPEGPVLGPNGQGPTPYDMPTLPPGQRGNDPQFQPQFPMPQGPTNGMTLPMPPADWQLEIYGRNDYARPNIETIYPYFRYLRCPQHGNYILNHDMAYHEAQWIVRNGISFRLYHETLSYFRRLRICTPQGEFWAFPERQSVAVTHEALRLRPDFSLRDFDHHYRRVIREGARGRIAIQEALRRMDRCYHSFDIDVVVRW